MSTHAGSSPSGSRDDVPPKPSAVPQRPVTAALLVAVMAVGSVVIWLASPVAWLWIASQMTSSSQPTIGPYLLVLVGMTVTAVLIGKGLGKVNRVHMQVTGRLRAKREPSAWNRSMRGERVPTRDRGVLDKVMLVSVLAALTIFAVWFFGFAGSSIG